MDKFKEIRPVVLGVVKKDIKFQLAKDMTRLKMKIFIDVQAEVLNFQKIAKML